MKVSQIVVVALIVLGVFAGDLSNPKPCDKDNGSQGPAGSGSCANGDISDSLRIVSYENSIEQIASTTPILSFAALAQHVMKVSKQALGFEAVLSDEALASYSWFFRLRHMPEPFVYAAESTKNDVERTVRYAFTRPEFLKRHHVRSCKINELIAAVKTSIETPTGFVFRIIEGDQDEYHSVHLHQLNVIQHYFAAVHTESKLFVAVVSSEVLGEFIKGHGGQNATIERADAAQFLRQWLLNQWVNLWVCTNPTHGTK